MTIFISLLRGINVGGQKRVPMAELRALYASLGFGRIATCIQSGNVIFESAQTDESILTGRLENAVEERFGFPVAVLIRSLEAWRLLARRHPLQSRADAAHLHVAFLVRAPGADPVRALAALETGEDSYTVKGSEIFLHCPNGYARSKLTNTVIEKKLGMAATTRNWKTVCRLLEMAEAAAG